MPLDDQIRDQLHRERMRAQRPVVSSAVLAEVGPAMRRARRLRIATTTTAAVLLVGGTAVAAQSIRSDRATVVTSSSSLEIIDEVDDEPTVIAPIISVAPSASDPPDGERSDTDRPVLPIVPATPTGGDRTGDGPVDDTVPSVDTRDTLDADGDDDTSAAPTTTDAAPLTTVPTVVPTTLPLPPAPETTASPTTVTPTTVATTSIQRFESACGSALADLSTGVVELLDVMPAPGYDYRLEDPDEDGIVIQFTGDGEDCELKIEF